MNPPITGMVYRGFSCDVISSQFCKSSYSRLPCWFPLSMERHRKHNKMSCYFYSVHTTIPYLTEWQEYWQTHLVEILNCSAKWIKSSSIFFCFSIPRHTKGNQAAGQNRACIGVYRVMQTLYRWILIPTLLVLIENLYFFQHKRHILRYKLFTQQHNYWKSNIFHLVDQKSKEFAHIVHGPFNLDQNSGPGNFQNYHGVHLFSGIVITLLAIVSRKHTAIIFSR